MFLKSSICCNLIGRIAAKNFIILPSNFGNIAVCYQLIVHEVLFWQLLPSHFKIVPTSKNLTFKIRKCIVISYLQ